MRKCQNHKVAIELGNIFSFHGAEQYPMIFTIGTISGTKITADSADEGVSGHVDLLGALAFYEGTVDTPDCTSTELKFAPPPLNNNISRHVIAQTSSYFKFSCLYKDQRVDLDNILDESNYHTSKSILGVPVIGLDGEMLGVVYSSGTHCDAKVGLHTDYMVSEIRELCEPASNVPVLSLKETLKLYYVWKFPHGGVSTSTS